MSKCNLEILGAVTATSIFSLLQTTELPLLVFVEKPKPVNKKIP